MFIAERLSMIAGRVLGWWGVAPTSVPLRNAIIGVACAQTLVPFRNTITQATAVHMAANGRSSVFAIRK